MDQERTTIDFCGRTCCPVVEIHPDGMVALGGPEEGYTFWNKGSFQAFVEAAKAGRFDEHIGPKDP